LTNSNFVGIRPTAAEQDISILLKRQVKYLLKMNSTKNLNKKLFQVFERAKNLRANATEKTLAIAMTTSLRIDHAVPTNVA